MSDTVNYWQSPNTEVAAEADTLRGDLTPVMLRYLKEASPWIRFLGILGYIGAVLLLVTGIIFMITTPAGFSNINAGSFTSLVGAFMGVFSLAMGLVAFFPARFTHQFGVKIRDYLLSSGEKDLEEAFRYNRARWKFCGILAIVYLALIPLVIIGSVLAALF
jgi:uncharacterized membrane protein SirB2